MAAGVSMPMGLVRMMQKLPVLPVVPDVAKGIEGVLPKFFPAISQMIPS